MSNQIEMITLEELVSKDHLYRKFKELWNLKPIEVRLNQLESTDSNYKGYGLFRLFLCLLLQFIEDISDRELEVYLQDSAAAKWFTGFNLLDKTPDHSLFGKVRSRIGTRKLSEIFASLRNQLKQQGFMSEVFTFVDASHLISKASLWQERDKAIQEKYETLNNEVLSKITTADKEAKIGSKGKNKFWYGFKRHTSVDMNSGLINKVAVTQANVTDAKGVKHILPNTGAVFGDKGYCTKDSTNEIKKKGLHDCTIKKNNMKNKNPNKDKWISQMRAPYERVFSKVDHRCRYRGIVKNQFTAFMEAIVFDLKRLVVLKAEELSVTLSATNFSTVTNSSSYSSTSFSPGIIRSS